MTTAEYIAELRRLLCLPPFDSAVVVQLPEMAAQIRALEAHVAELEATLADAEAKLARALDSATGMVP